MTHLPIGSEAAAFASLGRLVARIVEYGTTSYPEAVARRLRLLNGLSAVVVLATMSVAVTYAMNHSRLYSLSMWVVVSGVFYAATPLFHRFGEIAAVIYFSVCLATFFLLHGHLSGSADGTHYFMLAAPTIILFIGSKRLFLSFTLMSLMLGSFCPVEFLLPRVSTIWPLPAELAAAKRPIAILGASLIVFGSIYSALRTAEKAETALAREYSRSEALLLNLMPNSIADRLKSNPEAIIADQFEEVTILFADIVDFTPRAARLSPAGVVGFLNRVFSEFDRLAEKHGLKKSRRSATLTWSRAACLSCGTGTQQRLRTWRWT